MNMVEAAPLPTPRRNIRREKPRVVFAMITLSSPAYRSSRRIVGNGNTVCRLQSDHDMPHRAARVKVTPLLAERCALPRPVLAPTNVNRDATKASSSPK